jgi:sialic acid synthase SpsE/sugar phosphate isomerase/epimerase
MEKLTLKIGEILIGQGQNTFIIAEVGNNHNGEIEKAIEMVDLAVSLGIDCVKFQMRHLEQVYRKRSLKRDGDDLGTEYVLDLLDRFQLTVEEHRQLKEYCEQKRIIYLCTPWDEKSLKVLESFGVVGYKVASADMTNFPLIKKLCQTGKPLIVSTGMSSDEEIQKTVAFLNTNKAKFVLLHCNSTYPAPFHDINLRYLKKLKEYHSLVGYSGHERGIAVSLAAVALGAQVLERHFTLDRNMEGPDHAASLEFADFKTLVESIHQIDESMGKECESRKRSQGEMINRENLAKSLVAARPLKAGSTVRKEDVRVLSPGQGLSPQYFEELIGIVLDRDMVEEDYFFITDIHKNGSKVRNYSFKHPWGIPVRYHDFAKYYKISNLDLIEFHLSYTDLDLQLEDYLHGEYDLDFVVHAPELFQGSRLMDLATPDEAYRDFSIRETQRVIDITNDLKKFFPRTKRPMIVANIGGFTMDEKLPVEILPEYYDRFFQSLQKLDMEGVELIPQTMAPFPWHFGGQRHQNIFVFADEIVKYCEKFGLRMCFDISHSKLTCNRYNLDFYSFAEKIAPYTGHLHLGDSQGLNGEGLQVGEGEIDFVRLGKILNQLAPSVSFIPEIWQGHKNEGDGFWIALERLEGTL